MRVPTHRDAFAVLCLQAKDDGREHVLFGDSMPRVRSVVDPFLVGELFPEIYLEFPLAGEPFLDVTLLLDDLAPGTHVDSPLASGSEAALDFYARARANYSNIVCGFELDCVAANVPAAAMHFQPRDNHELVRPFCEALGEPTRADLYLAQNARMPGGWPLSFFGFFRGRPGSPLRVCGYLGREEHKACANDPARIGRALEQAGFSAFDDAMLGQAARVLSIAPQGADFQLDVWPDGGIGDIFAIDLRFDNMTAPELRKSFSGGVCATVVEQLREWGIADNRCDLLADMVFTRGVPVEADDGTMQVYGFTLIPGWLKVRWKNGVLQPAKMYLRASAGFAK